MALAIKLDLKLSFQKIEPYFAFEILWRSSSSRFRFRRFRSFGSSENFSVKTESDISKRLFDDDDEDDNSIKRNAKLSRKNTHFEFSSKPLKRNQNGFVKIFAPPFRMSAFGITVHGHWRHRRR